MVLLRKWRDRSAVLRRRRSRDCHIQKILTSKAFTLVIRRLGPHVNIVIFPERPTREIKESKVSIHRAAILVGVAFLSPLLAQAPVVNAARGVEQFAKKSATVQKRLVSELREVASAIGGDYHDAMRVVLAAADERKDVAGKVGKFKKPKKRAPKKAVDSWQMPTTLTYVYGRRLIEPEGRTKTQRLQLARRVAVELILLGLMPDADRLLAELERELDSDRAADQFAAFLESWRNGDESFYEALDRTAGTEDSVFFYDVMLGDFVAGFAKKSKDIKKGLNASHDALHEGFLCYRQYRAFREAVALSLVLPPDVPLPQHLKRYEEKLTGSYSLREQVLMTLALHGFDPMAVVKLVTENADPLSNPLWGNRHDPYPAWTRSFEAAIPGMVEDAGSTDAFLKMGIEKRQSDARKIRKIAGIVGFLPM